MSATYENPSFYTNPFNPSNEEYFKFVNLNDLGTLIDPNTEVNQHQKLLEKSKRIMKRENAKKRTKAKVMMDTSKNLLLKKEENSENMEDFEGDFGDLSEKDKKKLQQKIRNRVSAQQSRDRKKVYIGNLEQQNADLLSENTFLKQEVHYLKQENEHLKHENSYLRSQIPNETELGESFSDNRETSILNSDVVTNYLNDETTNHSEYSSPFHTSNGSAAGNALKYTMALLSIVCLVMVVGSGSYNEMNEVNVFKGKTVSTDLMEFSKGDFLLNSEKSLIQLSNYPNLKYIQEYRTNIINKVLVPEKLPGKNPIVSYSNEKRGFLEEKNETQLVLFSETQDEYPLSTLFCPNTYIYEPEVIIFY